MLDPTPLELRPERGELAEVLGHPIAHLSISRGCRGRCAYCGPAALLDLEVEERLGCGADRSELRARGVGGQSHRSLESICDEMLKSTLLDPHIVDAAPGSFSICITRL